MVESAESETDPGARRVPAALVVALVFVVLGVVYLGDLGPYPLQDPDEGRYAEIPREMVESGDWVTPRLNYAPYFEKPPLVYWLVGLSYASFGIHEWSARLPSAVAGLWCVWLTFSLGRAWYGWRAGWLAGGMLATSPLFFALSQSITPDVLLTACMTTALVAVAKARASTRKSRWVLIASIACAMGVLTKGLVGLLLPGWIALAFLWLRSDSRTIREFLRPLPIAVFLAVTLPWFVYLGLTYPEFLHFFFVREHFGRFFGDVGHPAHFFYYVPILALGALPWTGLAAGLAFSRDARGAALDLRGEGCAFLIVWGVSVVLFFELAGSKLPTYVLPAFPPVAILLGAWIDRVLHDVRRADVAVSWLLRVLLGIGAVAMGTAFVAGLLSTELAEQLAISGGVMTSAVAGVGTLGIILFLGGLVGLLGFRSPTARIAVAIGALLFAFAGALDAREAVKTSKRIARVVAEEARDGELVVKYAKLWQGLPFYLRRRVVMVKHFDEISHGVARSEDSESFFWESLEPLRERWSSGERVFILSDAKLEDELAAKLSPPPIRIYRDGRRAIFSNRASSP